MEIWGIILCHIFKKGPVKPMFFTTLNMMSTIILTRLYNSFNDLSVSMSRDLNVIMFKSFNDMFTFRAVTHLKPSKRLF